MYFLVHHLWAPSILSPSRLIYRSCCGSWYRTMASSHNVASSLYGQICRHCSSRELEQAFSSRICTEVTSEWEVQSLCMPGISNTLWRHKFIHGIRTEGWPKSIESCCWQFIDAQSPYFARCRHTRYRPECISLNAVISDEGFLLHMALP